MKAAAQWRFISAARYPIWITQVVFAGVDEAGKSRCWRRLSWKSNPHYFLQAVLDDNLVVVRLLLHHGAGLNKKVPSSSASQLTSSTSSSTSSSSVITMPQSEFWGRGQLDSTSRSSGKWSSSNSRVSHPFFLSSSLSSSNWMKIKNYFLRIVQFSEKIGLDEELFGPKLFFTLKLIRLNASF